MMSDYSINAKSKWACAPISDTDPKVLTAASQDQIVKVHCCAPFLNKIAMSPESSLEMLVNKISTSSRFISAHSDFCTNYHSCILFLFSAFPVAHTSHTLLTHKSIPWKLVASTSAQVSLCYTIGIMVANEQHQWVWVIVGCWSTCSIKSA